MVKLEGRKCLMKEIKYITKEVDIKLSDQGGNLPKSKLTFAFIAKKMQKQ